MNFCHSITTGDKNEKKKKQQKTKTYYYRSYLQTQHSSTRTTEQKTNLNTLLWYRRTFNAGGGRKRSKACSTRI